MVSIFLTKPIYVCALLSFGSRWAGTGPAPQQTPAVGKWSDVYAHAGCQGSGDQGDVALQDLGNEKTSIDQCKQACEQNPKCGFIDHADVTDGHCVLYATCATAAPCGNTGWDTYQLGRNDSAPFAGCGSRPPPPPPGPPSPSPSDPSGFDCQVRLLAMDFAANILGAAVNTSAVAASLNLDEDTWCKPNASTRAAASTAPASSVPLSKTIAPMTEETTGGHGNRNGAAVASSTFYVDGSTGSDSNPGALATPFKTLQKAQAASRAAGAGSIVLVRGGTYFVGETLVFGEADSGNTWSSYGTEDVVFSGGVDLRGLKWSKSATNPQALEAALPPGYTGPTIKTLFVDGMREVRAKYPNGDPLIPGAAGGYAAQAAGAAGTTYSPNGDLFPDTVAVNSEGGVLLSKGSSVGNVAMNFTVSEPESNFNPTRNDFNVSKAIYCFSPRICSRTLMGGRSTPSAFFYRGGSLLPSSYADGRSRADVIAF